MNDKKKNPHHILAHEDPHERTGLSLSEKVTTYKPLIIVLCLSLGMSLALNQGAGVHFVNALMGTFLCALSSLKLLNVKGFARVFKEYDEGAKRFPPYATAYPFIEAALGIFYLGGFLPVLTNIVMLATLVLNTIGVVKVIYMGRTVQCGCAGAVYNLPVGNITLSENMIMALMAGVNLFYGS